MPDGSPMEKRETEPRHRGNEIHDELVAKAMQAFESVALELHTNVAFGYGYQPGSDMHRERLLAAVRERMAQPAQALCLELTSAQELGEQLGEARAKDAIARGVKVVADTLAVVRRGHLKAVPKPASERFPMETLVRFVNGASAQLVKNIQTGYIAVGGLRNRGEVPALDARTAAVYMSVALGRAAGHALATHLGVVGANDMGLGRTMRDAFLDGVNTQLGPVLDGLVAKVN